MNAKIGNESLVFSFVQKRGIEPAWHQIFVTINGNETVLASSHDLVELDSPTCNTLYYLRAWLTIADNGVNGKRSQNFEPINGAAGEVLHIQSIAEHYLGKLDCGSTNKKRDFACTNKPSACADLRDLYNLTGNINHESTKQSETGRSGREYYSGG